MINIAIGKIFKKNIYYRMKLYQTTLRGHLHELRSVRPK